MTTDPSHEQRPLHDPTEPLPRHDPTGQSGKPYLVTLFVVLLVLVLAVFLVLGVVTLT